MPKTYPDGWREIVSIGDSVEGTNFIPFKVPYRGPWTLWTLKRRKPEVKFIIDMCGSSKYYTPSECAAAGITHRKIEMQPDRRGVPAENYVQEFFRAVQEAEDILEEGELVGVHCTRGLNRTGYMICRWMIDRAGVSPEVAIEAFNEARGHDMDRDNYLADLQMRAAAGDI